MSEGTTSTFSSSSSRSLIVDVITTNHEPSEPPARFTLDPRLRLFTELPPEFTFTDLKLARAELETVVGRHKEADDEPAG